MNPKTKLISAGRIELFEERLNSFLSNLAEGIMIVDIKFSTAALSSSVEYSALVHYQETATWE